MYRSGCRPHSPESLAHLVGLVRTWCVCAAEVQAVFTRQQGPIHYENPSALSDLTCRMFSMSETPLT